MGLQSVIRAIYPAQCIACDELTEAEFGLCAACWRDTPFISGLVCDACGTPLPGDEGGDPVHCDDCMVVARPWSRGRAAFGYGATGRRLVLALKHGDRTDLAQAAGRWLARAAGPLVQADTVVVPVPLHWTRLLRRRYNQAALLAHAVARAIDRPCAPDALLRTRRTQSLDGHGREARFKVLQGAMAVHPKRGGLIAGKSVLLVDDVMTSGATFAAATEACRAAGATQVCVLVLARVAKDA